MMLYDASEISTACNPVYSAEGYMGGIYFGKRPFWLIIQTGNLSRRKDDFLMQFNLVNNFQEKMSFEIKENLSTFLILFLTFVGIHLLPSLQAVKIRYFETETQRPTKCSVSEHTYDFHTYVDSTLLRF